jgi:hypothetical protein
VRYELIALHAGGKCVAMPLLSVSILQDRQHAARGKHYCPDKQRLHGEDRLQAEETMQGPQALQEQAMKGSDKQIDDAWFMHGLCMIYDTLLSTDVKTVSL